MKSAEKKLCQRMKIFYSTGCDESDIDEKYANGTAAKERR